MFRNPVHQALMVLTGAILAAAFVAGSLLHQKAAPTAGAATNPIRLAFQDQIDDALFIIAMEKDFFQTAGIPVAAVDSKKGSAAEDLFSGKADIATMDDSTAIIAVSRRLPLTIIASTGTYRQASQEESYPLLLVASNNLLRQRPEIVRDLLATLQRAENFMGENPAEAEAVLSKATDQAPLSVQDSLRRHEFRLSLDESVLAGLEAKAEVLRRQGIIDRLPDFKKTADGGYLPPNNVASQPES